jgi:hypothetical protein
MNNIFEKFFENLEPKVESDRCRRLFSASSSEPCDTDLQAVINHVERCKSLLDVVSLKPDDQVDPWAWCVSSNTLKHKNDQFFALKFFNVVSRGSREEKQWVQPLIVEKNNPSGLLGQIFAQKNGDLYWLVQIKSEPGDVHGFNLTTTVQATLENIRAPGHFNKVPLLRYFLETADKDELLFCVPVQEDGGRFFRKVNYLVALEVCYDASLAGDNFVWVKHSNIVSLIKKNVLPISAQLRFMACQTLG